MSRPEQGKLKYVNITGNALKLEAEQLAIERWPNIKLEELKHINVALKAAKAELLPALDRIRTRAYNAMSAEDKALHVPPTESKATAYALDHCMSLVTEIIGLKDDTTSSWGPAVKKARTE